MGAQRCYRIASVLLAAAALGSGGVMAQDPKAAGATPATSWAGKVTPGGGSELILDAKQTEAVRRVSKYFNDLENMRGAFVQLDPDKKRSRGRFFVQKPGKFRFDYAPPNRKVMLSDGRLLRIQEADSQGNPDAAELDNTPFRLLLKKDVDLLRDARILDVQESDDLVVVALQDKSPDAPGRVQLFFSKKPGFDLKEWVVLDPQGLETRVEISELNKADKIDPKLFIWESDFFKRQ